MQNPKNRPKFAIWVPSHKFVGLYLRNQGTYQQSEKNLFNSDISPTCLYKMVNFGPLVAEIVSLVWGTPGNFNGFHILAALLHGTLVVGIRETAALNRGRHLYLTGRPSRWALADILVRQWIDWDSTWLQWYRDFLTCKLNSMWSVQFKENYVVLDKNVCRSKIPILKYNSNALGFRLKYVYKCKTVAQSCCMPISQDALILIYVHHKYTKQSTPIHC